MKKEKIEGVIRHALTTIGGVLIAKGLIEDAIVTEAIGAIITLVGITWSVIDKK
jgi:hypothetical protein